MKWVSIEKLNRDPEVASTLLRLMMVVNDCALADESLAMWQSEQSESRNVRRQEAAKYFVELQIAHLYEGMKIIHEMSSSSTLLRYVDQSDQPTRTEFRRLVAFLSDRRYESLIGRVRHNLAFHYDAKLTARVLAQCVARTPDALLAISMGNKSSDWLFEPGALVSEQIAVREIFKIAENEDINTVTGEILQEVQALAHDFNRFAGHFVWQHTSP
jgi:hypothetical protein